MFKQDIVFTKNVGLFIESLRLLNPSVMDDLIKQGSDNLPFQ